MENSDLDLEIGKLTGPGRRPVQLDYAVIRPLRASDLALLAIPAETPAISIKKLSERHHALARLIAAGAAPSEAAMVIGYELSRVSVLQGDPSFQELVSFYRDKVDTEFAETMGQLAGLSKDLLMELRNRFDDDPSKFSLRDIKEFLGFTLDRTGYGPTQKTETTVNVNLSQRLEEARKRALDARRQHIIDITPREAAE
jgi:hypothetical protein